MFNSFFETPAPSAPAEPVVPARDAVAELRAEAAKSGEVLIVDAVQSPAVIALFSRIEAADASGDHLLARQLTVEARTIDPENPLVLQYTAEALLRAESYLEAETLAHRSFEGSAQLGPLCVRNWLTIAEARLAQRNVEGESEARARALQCPVKPVQRL